MSKASDSGRSFLDGVLAKLPEDQRATVRAAIEANEGALEVLGSGALGQAEINRQFTELTKQRETLESQRTELVAQGEKLTSWYDANKGALDDYLAHKEVIEKLKTGNGGTVIENKGLTAEEVAAMMEARDRAFAGAFALGTNLSAAHLHMFNEPLNMQELMADPKVGTVIDRASGKVYGLQDAYNAKYGEKVAERHKAIEDKRIKDLVDQGVQERLKALPQNQQAPYPLRDSGSPLDALTADRKPSDYSVDSAVAEYNRLQQARNGAPV